MKYKSYASSKHRLETRDKQDNQNGMLGCYNKLCCAIVLQACRDYIRAKHKREIKGVYYLNELEDSCRSFFLGEDIKMYTTIDGKKILEELDNSSWDKFYKLTFKRGKKGRDNI